MQGYFYKSEAPQIQRNRLDIGDEVVREMNREVNRERTRMGARTRKRLLALACVLFAAFASPAAFADPPTVIAPTGDQDFDQGTDPNLDAAAAFDDVDGDTLTYSETGLPASLSIDTDSGLISGTLTNDDWLNGPDYSVVVTADDGADSVDDAFTLTVNNVNDDPTVDAATGDQDFDQGTDPNLNISGAFDDIDGDTLTYSETGLPGTLSLDTNSGLISGTLTNDDWLNGPDYSIVITADDGNGGTVDDAFTLTVNNVNDAPTADAQSLQTDEDVDLVLTLTGSDPDDDALTFEIATDPASGTLDCSDEDCTYTPNLDFTGDDSFTFTVDDGEFTSAEATIDITVNSVNDAPTADAQALATDEDVALAITLTGSDPEDDALTFAIVADPVSGTLDCTDADCTYTPDLDFTGDDSFTFTVDDGEFTSAEATIDITVNALNDVPIADDQDLETDEDVELAITLTATDPEDDALTFAVATDPANGTVDCTDADCTYTPDLDFNGDDSFTFTADDGELTSAEATVTITVNAVNDAPLADPQTLNTAEDTPLDITLTGTDVEDDALTFEIVTDPVSGTLDCTDADCTYTPDLDFTGDDSFTFTVDDGEFTSAEETITIGVDSVNDGPTADAQSLQTDEDVALVFVLTGTDPDGDDLTFSIVTEPVSGTLDCTDADCTYTPDLDFNGEDSFTFTVDDGELTSAEAIIDIAINSVNDVPVADAQDLSTGEDEELAITLTATDVEEAALTFAIVVEPVSGTLECTEADCTYTPDLDFTGDDSFTFTANDGELTSEEATISIAVDEVDDAPVIEDQVVLETDEDVALTITLDDLTITDVDSEPETFVLSVQDGENYSRIDNTITPDPDFNGDLTVPVTVSDGSNDSDVFDLLVTVNAINDVPVIIDQVTLSTPEDASLTVLITDLTVVDPDNVFPDEFSLQLLDGNNYTVAGNTISPEPNFNGTLNVPATVSDGIDTSAEFVLTVEVTGENDNPVLESEIEAPPALEGDPYTLDVSPYFSDADGDVLVFTATGLPGSGNLTFNQQTGVLSGTPRVEDARDTDPYIIVITASDEQPGSVPAQGQFDLNISALARANVSLEIVVAPDPAMLNDELNWTVTASNITGPQPVSNIELTGSFVGSGLEISSESGCTIQEGTAQVSDFTCMLGDLPVGASASAVFTTMTADAGDVVLFGTAETTDNFPLDPNTDDNSRQLAVGVAESFSNGVVQVLGNAEVRSVAAGDINGDGIIDLLAGTAAGQAIQVFLGDGFRGFADTPISLPDSSKNEGMALADFDGNGTLDLVVANGDGQEDVVYSNDGAGNFTSMASLGLSFANDVAVGDFDNDGNFDIVIATLQANPVFYGDGTGVFVMDAETLGNANSQSVIVAKLNGDNRDDIVFANVGDDSQVWIKNSADGFRLGSTLAIGDSVSVVSGRFGGDFRPDLAFGRTSTSAGDLAANPVLINDGDGGFSVPAELLGTSPTSDILSGDVNNDGRDDLVFINASGVHQIWTATGTGFELHGEQIVDFDSVAGVLTELGMSDVDEPGGVDLAMGGAIVSGLGLYLNDSLGNLGQGDAVEPVLTLVGDSSIDVPSGSNYSDDGATAEDNIDGDITQSIIVSNPVNTALVGTYTVRYDVVDKAGNSAETLTRTVTVSPSVGSGGGGGGSVSPITLLLLILLTWLIAYQAKSAIIHAGVRVKHK